MSGIAREGAAVRRAAAAELVAVGAEAAPLLAELHRRAFPPGQSWGRDALATMLGLPGTFALWARVPGGAEGGGPAGFVLARVAAEEAEILTLAVLPERRGAGIGTALLRGAATVAAARGARTLFLEVSEANAAARALYAAAGFTGRGRRPRYYADGSDALVLGLSLPCGSAAG
ncbi:GNAT family N-acetyltransferase [Caldovatus aquaticus]|uniref:GNAT family N-acetyltransferase n=1 Tax=Caldovatus aquaticus TaxID=2865671 RepID=A0ABS7F0U2_9PROT|nr:GNAT family N-acetyltransferase [Caldovatus aquaticus]MBW8268375.1 GNAT family N-acetyltransferase [Caldovatus aquaticus]